MEKKIKTASIILSSLSILMVLSQLICGLWLASHGSDPSSVSFHVRFGIATVLITLITLIVLLVFGLRR